MTSFVRADRPARDDSALWRCRSRDSPPSAEAQDQGPTTSDLHFRQALEHCEHDR
jgi:hypothetical protein